MFGFGGNRPGQLGLQIFCERVQEWLASPAAEVAVTNGTVPSLQELLVDYLTSLCSNTRSGVPLGE
ncbi:hypothetical protein SK128_005549 [Halocaridina rubra]|uniref:Uncharacterized protein n=1 Tax=Halocaridina rubra TaxID=373956 RepID=A0AAN9A324_HALRR